MRHVRLSAFVLSVLLGVGLLGAGCSGASQDPEALVGPEWVVEQFRASGGSLEPAIEGVALTITFESEDAFGGSGGVNRYGGTYTADARGALELSDVTSTLIAGPPDAQEQETAFFETLGEVRRYRVAGDVLELFDGADNVLVRLKSAE